MRRNWRSNRIFLLILSLFACTGLIILSLSGVLAPVEGAAATPLQALAGLFNRVALNITGGITDLTELNSLRQRNAELEEALAQFQSELVELREISSDYQRLADLLSYTNTREDLEYVTADVIFFDQNSFLRTLSINRGTRDGLAVGMPVVTGQGLVGRILEVTANASRVLLVTDPSSFVSARLQTTRAEGTVVGLRAGTLRMQMIELNQTVQEGDLVITSGLGGNFPADIVIGQVTSVQRLENALDQTAELRSLIDFDTLEFVLVITNFQPVDISIFEQEADN